MRVNHVKRTLASGGASIGTIVNFCHNPALVRLIAGTGFDFVMLDAQHSGFSTERLGLMCDLARAEDIVPVIRIPGVESAERYLAATAPMGLMCPNIESRTQVDRLLSAMYFPPDGARGATTSVVRDYRGAAGLDANGLVNSNMQLIIQIESHDAVDQVEQILDGGGVDVVEVGRSDLSQSLGVPGEREHPAVLEALSHVAEACRKHGVALGCSAQAEHDVRDLLARGARWLMYASDMAILESAYQAGSRMFRAAIAAVAA